MRPNNFGSSDIVEDAELSKDFLGRKIRPIIWSHAENKYPHEYSAIIQDLASRGYMVFASYHEDGSCRYAQDRHEREIFYRKETNWVNQRVKELCL